jgi:hypothetical protein
MTEIRQDSPGDASDTAMNDWLAEFAARRWILVDSLGPDPHIDRAKEVYLTLRHLDPTIAAEQDLADHPETRWQEDSGWSTAI